MSLMSMSPLLRRALVADALISAAAGVLMSLASRPLQGLLGLPASLMLTAGLLLFPWSLALFWMTRQPAVRRSAVWTVIALNALWIVESVWVSLGGSFTPNGWGHAFVAVQALAVFALAELEFMGLRRSHVAMA